MTRALVDPVVDFNSISVVHFFVQFTKIFCFYFFLLLLSDLLLVILGGNCWMGTRDDLDPFTIFVDFWTAKDMCEDAGLSAFKTKLLFCFGALVSMVVVK